MKPRAATVHRIVQCWTSTPLRGGLILTLLTLVVYFPAFFCDFVWDDEDNVIDNQTLRSVSGLVHIWTDVFANQQYYPITHSSFWVEYQLWGLSPIGYHVVNVCFQALAAVLLFLILRRLELRGAWLVAALFAIHPIQVESVAWITERKNVLSGVFYMATALAYLKFIGIGPEKDDGAESSTPSTRRLNYLGVLLLFSAALLSKTNTSTLPVALMLVLWWKRPVANLKEMLTLAPLLLLSVAGGMLTAWLEMQHMQAKWDWPLVDRTLIAGRAFWFYIGQILVPRDMVFVYPLWRIDTGVWWQYLPPILAVLLFAALAAAVKRIGKGPLAGALFYLVSVGPALGFFNVAYHRFSYVQDHFQYLAFIGVAALAVTGVARLLDRLGTSRHVVTIGAAVLVLLLAGGLSRHQIKSFRTYETLFSHSLLHNPDAWLAQYNLGWYYQRQGRPEAAFERYREAIRIRPDDSRAYNNLGVALSSAGRLNEAVVYLEKTAKMNPDVPDVHKNLGMALAGAGKPRKAVDALRQALRLQPGWATVERQIAWIYATSPEGSFRDGKRALFYANAACSHTSDNFTACFDVQGAALAELRMFGEAVQAATRALQMARELGYEGDRLQAMEARLKSYQQKRPLRYDTLSEKFCR